MHSLSEGVVDEVNFASSMSGIDPSALIDSVAVNDGNAAVADARLRRANSRLVPPSGRRPALRSLARKAAVGCIADIDIADLDGNDVGPVPRLSHRPLFTAPNSRKRPKAVRSCRQLVALEQAMTRRRLTARRCPVAAP